MCQTRNKALKFATLPTGVNANVVCPYIARDNRLVWCMLANRYGIVTWLLPETSFVV